MRIIVCAALLTMPIQAGAQDGDSKRMHKPFVITKELGRSSIDLTRCAVSEQDGEAMLSAQFTAAGMGAGPHVKREASAVATGDIDNDGVDFSWGATNTGATSTKGGGAGRIVPTVTGNAIKTKGAGGSDRSAGQACAAPSPQGMLLPAVQKRTAQPAARCAVSGDPASPTFTVSMPLSMFGPDAKTGHVTLNKRGENPGDGWSVVTCDWSAVAKDTPMISTYDLKASKKL